MKRENEAVIAPVIKEHDRRIKQIMKDFAHQVHLDENIKARWEDDDNDGPHARYRYFSAGRHGTFSLVIQKTEDLEGSAFVSGFGRISDTDLETLGEKIGFETGIDTYSLGNLENPEPDAPAYVEIRCEDSGVSRSGFLMAAALGTNTSRLSLKAYLVSGGTQRELYTAHFEAEGNPELLSGYWRERGEKALRELDMELQKAGWRYVSSGQWWYSRTYER